MADTAFQIQYRDEFIHGFEDRVSVLRQCVITESIIKGNQAVFLVADSGVTTSATSRGTNGLIPARSDNMVQNTATLSEWHDLVRKTGFNVFASQGDQRRIMQETTMAVINRKVDSDIIGALDTATNTAGGALKASMDLVTRAQVILGNNFVDLSDEDNLFAVVTPAFMGYLRQIPEFASADYVDVKPMSGPNRRMLRWAGVNWITHARLTGVGTATEKCYMFHRNAVGSAVDKGNLATPVGYDEEQDYSWARASGFFGSKLLQNVGIVQVKHDGSAYVAV